MSIRLAAASGRAVRAGGGGEPGRRLGVGDRAGQRHRVRSGGGDFHRGLAGAVRAIREIDAGNIHINWTPLWRADLMPYGGLKGSGIGKEGPRTGGRGDDRGEDGRVARPPLVTPGNTLPCPASSREHRDEQQSFG